MSAEGLKQDKATINNNAPISVVAKNSD